MGDPQPPAADSEDGPETVMVPEDVRIETIVDIHDNNPGFPGAAKNRYECF